MNSIKELISYLTNQLKFWFIIKEWEQGLQLRNGKIMRKLNAGIYVKIPFIDQIFCQALRVKDIVVSQVNFTTGDNKCITASSAAFYRINDIEKFYNGYAEPNSIIANIICNEMNKHFLSINFNDFCQVTYEKRILDSLKEINDKGFEFTDFKLTTFSNARTYRIIKDNLYSQKDNNLDDQLY